MYGLRDQLISRCDDASKEKDAEAKEKIEVQNSWEVLKKKETKSESREIRGALSASIRFCVHASRCNFFHFCVDNFRCIFFRCIFFHFCVDTFCWILFHFSVNAFCLFSSAAFPSTSALMLFYILFRFCIDTFGCFFFLLLRWYLPLHFISLQPWRLPQHFFFNFCIDTFSCIFFRSCHIS